MGSISHQWESDPLFSAAEVVQDSADRMDSIFHLLLHEKSLKSEHPDPKLLLSIDYHKRDLATSLETVKWQLEDFERAVCASSMTKSQMREDIVSRHKQFVRAIREHITYVEKSWEDASVGDNMTNYEWINLNDQDRDGLALFLSGGNPTESANHHNVEDSSILKRFLDANAASSSKDSASGVVEHGSREIERLNINGISHIDHNSVSTKENNFRMEGSNFTARLGFEAPNSRLETSCNRHGEGESWDLEANEATPKNLFHENKLYGWWSRLNVFRFSNSLWTAYGSTVNRSYTKRLKDGEEQRHSPLYSDVSHGAKGQHRGMDLAAGYSQCRGVFFWVVTKVMYFCYWLGSCWARYRRSPYCGRVNQHSIRLILIILFTFLILGLLVSQIA